MQKVHQQAYIHTITDHHYASFKIYKNQISWFTRQEQEEERKKKQTIHLLLTKYIEFEECVDPLS